MQEARQTSYDSRWVDILPTHICSKLPNKTFTKLIARITNRKFIYSLTAFILHRNINLLIRKTMSPIEYFHASVAALAVIVRIVLLLPRKSVQPA